MNCAQLKLRGNIYLAPKKKVDLLASSRTQLDSFHRPSWIKFNQLFVLQNKEYKSWFQSIAVLVTFLYIIQILKRRRSCLIVLNANFLG